MLPALEPMAGAALAINLAFVNLERFRYRKKIRDHARKELDRLKPNGGGPLPWILESQWYKEVERLSALPDNDGAEPKGQASRCEMPDGIWGKLYIIFFEFHEDRVASYVMTLISLLVLIVGTAHAIGYLAPIHWVGAYSWAVTWFWLLAASILVPIGFVILGGCVVDWAKHYTSKNIRELEKMMKIGRAHV